MSKTRQLINRQLKALKLAVDALNTIQKMRYESALQAPDLAQEALEDILEALTGEGNDEAKGD